MVWSAAFSSSRLAATDLSRVMPQLCTSATSWLAVSPAELAWFSRLRQWRRNCAVPYESGLAAEMGRGCSTSIRSSPDLYEPSRCTLRSLNFHSCLEQTQNRHVPGRLSLMDQ